MSNVKHVYANPINPEICCVLALAVHTFSTPRIQNDDGGFSDTKLFAGSSQKARWSDILQDILKDWPSHADLGCSPQDVGTHSIRKGIATYLLQLVDGPSAIMVYLRAGWSLGNVPDRFAVCHLIYSYVITNLDIYLLERVGTN